MRFSHQHIYSTEDVTNPVATEILFRGTDNWGLSDAINNPSLFITHLEKMIEAKAQYIYNLLFDYPNNSFFINISPEQAAEEKFISYLKWFSFHKVPSSSIMIELTEDWSKADYKAVIANMRQARALGFGIALDDFGKGDTNIAVITDLMPNLIKIDMSIIHRAVDCQIGRKTVESLVRFFRDLDIKTVAEGIEGKEFLSVAITSNIDYVQGYMLHKPN